MQRCKGCASKKCNGGADSNWRSTQTVRRRSVMGNEMVWSQSEAEKMQRYAELRLQCNISPHHMQCTVGLAQCPAVRRVSSIPFGFQMVWRYIAQGVMHKSVMGCLLFYGAFGWFFLHTRSKCCALSIVKRAEDFTAVDLQHGRFTWIVHSYRTQNGRWIYSLSKNKSISRSCTEL